MSKLRSYLLLISLACHCVFSSEFEMLCMLRICVYVCVSVRIELSGVTFLYTSQQCV